MATTSHSNLSEALRAALDAYPSEADADIRPALRNAAKVLDERRDSEVAESEARKADSDQQVADSLIAMERLAKAEDTPPELREKARKAHRRLSLLHLADSNPQAAGEWARVHADAA
jgi:hypothetical protein